jgi:hypothetical protein
MKKLLFFTGMALFILLANTGCQKEPPADLLKDTTTTTAAPSILRRIKINQPSPTDPLDIVVALQYDTANRKINVYLDDTTTANPFDLLAVNYQFDANGYLISSNGLNNGTLQPDFSIVRNSNEQIQKIIEFNAEELNGVPYNDTVYFSYRQQAGQTVVQDSVHFYGASGFLTRQTSYTSQNQPATIQYSSGSNFGTPETYSYNGSGTLSHITTGSDTTDFTYDNASVTPTWSKLPLLFLGKDFYLFQTPLTGRLSYNFLSFIIESDFETVYNPLLTQPLSKIAKRGYVDFMNPQYKSKIINFTNTYTADGFPARISVLPVGDDPIYYRFEY